VYACSLISSFRPPSPSRYSSTIPSSSRVAISSPSPAQEGVPLE
jgi:hypothetical protein